MSYDCNDVLQAQDVTAAYEIFLDSFLALYNKSCPVRQNKKKEKSSDKLWLTKGLQNTMYREFVKHRGKDHKIKYKM